MASSSILSYDAVAECPTFPIDIAARVDDVPTVFQKSGPGIAFLVLVGESSLSDLVADPGTLALLTSPELCTRVGELFVIGRFYAGDAVPPEVRTEGKDSVWWPLIEDAGVRTFLARAIARLEGRLRTLGRWPSFDDWAQHEADADLGAPQPVPQTPLDYWWLIGDPQRDKSAHAVPIYPPQNGVYVRPDDGLIPVFSCALKAVLGQVAYSQTTHAPLRSGPISCLGCWLGGAAGQFGPQVAKGALLDERWRIEFATCDQHGQAKPSHFRVVDRGEVYDLNGCPDQGTQPIWVPERWRTKAPECTTGPWA